MRNRAEVRLAKSIERRGMASGVWPPWVRSTFPKGSVGHGWCAEIGEAISNTVYVALVRYLDNDAGGRVHLAIRTPSNAEPPWRDMQRIKNELFGQGRFAVQVCPPQDRLIDDADMYHLWIMPVGYEPGFGLHRDDHQSRPQSPTDGSETTKTGWGSDSPGSYDPTTGAE